MYPFCIDGLNKHLRIVFSCQVLVEAARNGQEKEVEEYSAIFMDHANKLVEVANLACSMSANEDGVKMVRYAAQQIQNLCPQVRVSCLL